MNAVQKKVRGRPRKGQTDRAADRRVLIDAAVAILDEGGSGALTARGVAERAGTAVGSVYTLFDSLELLRLEASAVTMHRLRDALTAALAACPARGTAERLLCLADAYLAFAAGNHPAWATLFERRTVAAPDPVQADIAALFGILEGVLRDGGGLPAAEIPVMARALWSSVHGMAYLADLGSLGPLGADDVRPMIDALVRAAVRGFPGGAGPARGGG
ncbi:TetR/AcrR family transcriptional regulator [Methylobacterium sp. J-070]|uniref:TetR/AcrR family transcriptional regulator n=1 Tax=Methylobacterium sp. J-070 TaxID=2836650 RepID=UPI001FB98F2E|nr:TetR/AcrR family transcriptional regulator [Methylobacterium sp. J-070]MCJ2048570.1 TetR/AcrR family transcriptional regulator [Methylobacterium sp. J-070]